MRDRDMGPRDHIGVKDTIHSGRGFAFSPLHREASQKPALLGLPPVFILFFESSLTHQEGVNCASRGTLVANCQVPQPLLSRSSACWPSPSPRKASCRKKTTPEFEFVCCKTHRHLQWGRDCILQGKKASNLGDQWRNATPRWLFSISLSPKPRSLFCPSLPRQLTSATCIAWTPPYAPTVEPGLANALEAPAGDQKASGGWGISHLTPLLPLISWGTPGSGRSCTLHGLSPFQTALLHLPPSWATKSLFSLSWEW